jgi:hypothetical protein
MAKPHPGKNQQPRVVDHPRQILLAALSIPPNPFVPPAHGFGRPCHQHTAQQPLPLHHPNHPHHTWQLRQGVRFDFPQDLVLPPHGVLLVVGFDPANTQHLAAFQSRYQIPHHLPILGPWTGRLNNAGETIELLRPDTLNPHRVPAILVDRVAYQDRDPWPISADGYGTSLQRHPLAAFGNDPAHWFAAPPTPGAENTVNLPPQIALTTPTTGSVFQRTVDILLNADASDPDGTITRVEFFVDGQPVGSVAQPPYCGPREGVTANLKGHAPVERRRLLKCELLKENASTVPASTQDGRFRDRASE